MRTTLLLVLATAGCSSTVTESRGVNRASYAGTTQLVFTNATPARMCNLSISSSTAGSYGDNWLPDGGLASGASLEVRIQPGTYNATWSTCRDDFKQPFYAGTLSGELAFTLDRQESQLYAYISDSIAPTTRAAVLGRQFHVVRAIGQTVDPARAQLAAVPSYAERRLMEESVPATDATVAKVDLHDCIDWSLANSTKKRPAKKAPAGEKRVDVTVASPSAYHRVRMY